MEGQPKENMKAKGENWRTVSTVEARRDFSELINRTSYGKERTIIRRNKKNLAVMIPFEDLSRLERLEELEDRLDLKDALAAQADVKKTGTESLAQVKKKLLSQK